VLLSVFDPPLYLLLLHRWTTEGDCRRPAASGSTKQQQVQPALVTCANASREQEQDAFNPT
jgi:hypothetical protein